MKNGTLMKPVELFKGKSDPNIVIDMEKLLVYFYGGTSNETTVNSVRYKKFAQSTTKFKLNC